MSQDDDKLDEIPKTDGVCYDAIDMYDPRKVSLGLLQWDKPDGKKSHVTDASRIAAFFTTPPDWKTLTERIRQREENSIDGDLNDLELEGECVSFLRQKIERGYALSNVEAAFLLQSMDESAARTGRWWREDLDRIDKVLSDARTLIRPNP